MILLIRHLPLALFFLLSITLESANQDALLFLLIACSSLFWLYRARKHIALKHIVFKRKQT
jgi:hypothetical protein